MADFNIDAPAPDDRASATKSSIRRESQSSNDSSVNGVDDKPASINNNLLEHCSAVDDERMGKLIVDDHRNSSNEDARGASDPPGKNKPQFGRDKTGKSTGTPQLADRSKSSAAEIDDPNSSIQDDAGKFSPRQKRPSFGRTDNVIQKKKSELAEQSISSGLVYKRAGSSERNSGNTSDRKKDQGDLSTRGARNHANPDADTSEGSAGVSRKPQVELPRKVADSPSNRATGSTVKRHEGAVERTARSSPTTESPTRVSEPRSSNDPTTVRNAKTRAGQPECERCGEPHVSYEKAYVHKYSSYLDCAGLAREENHANGRESKHETHVAALYRSRSLPRLSVHDSGIACSGNEPAMGQAPNTRQLVTDLKQLHTLKQHYYPEGGWGWIVLLVGMMVQVLSHGMHGSSGVLLQQMAGKFGRHVY